jgi:hypothetical protein
MTDLGTKYTKEDLISMGRAELRAAHGLTNTSEISDEFLVGEIKKITHEIYDEVGYKPLLEPNSPGYNAIRFYGLIKAAYILEPERGPTSISHARRYDYSNNDLDRLNYWRDRMIRALSKL